MVIFKGLYCELSSDKMYRHTGHVLLSCKETNKRTAQLYYHSMTTIILLVIKHQSTGSAKGSISSQLSNPQRFIQHDLKIVWS